MYTKFAVLSLIAALAGLSGCHRCCQNDCGCAGSGASMAPRMGDSTPSTPSAGTLPPAPSNMPQVSGAWAGRWDSSHPGHGGGLKCVVKEAGPQKWDAVFTAEFGPTKSYNVKLEGKPGDGAVLFGGKVDLGANDGGVFTWTGKATATEFTGKYEGGGDTGVFKMARVK